mmetsp:Transcript_1147/g.3766  ORF Transcript_1147/g.3766 Transcript_1147/m.3766 type:complete len:303 (-) Transcript_1147:5-913(-)
MSLKLIRDRNHSFQSGKRNASSKTTTHAFVCHAWCKSRATSAAHTTCCVSVCGNRRASNKCVCVASPASASRPIASPKLFLPTTVRISAVAGKSKTTGECCACFCEEFGNRPPPALAPFRPANSTKGVISRGKSRVIVVPTPGTEAHETCPRKLAIMFFVIAKPKPVPPYSRVEEVDACPNGLNTTSSLSLAIPMPVSMTSMRIQRRSGPGVVVPVAVVSSIAVVVRRVRARRVAGALPMPTSVSSPGDVPANTSQDPESARFGCDGEALFWRDVLPLPPRRTFPSTPPNTMSLPGIRSTRS